MTRTYHDIEAVTRLLQEKEKDLELAAKIGQQLLARNKTLEEKNSLLEAELLSSSEKITQLRHELLMKVELLQIYTNDLDESSLEVSPTGFKNFNLDLLQQRVKKLESDNVFLREEATQLASDTRYCEEKENQLVNDVIKQLNDANQQSSQLGEELSKKIEDNLRHQEESTQLLAQVVELQAGTKRLSRENEELTALVSVTRECQEELSTELALLKEKYSEVLDLLHDTQEQLRIFQRKNQPGSRGSQLSSRGPFSIRSGGNDSIASELFSLNFLGDDEDPNPPNRGLKVVDRVFDTVRLSSSRTGSPMPIASHGASAPPGLGYGGSSFSTPTKMSSNVFTHSAHVHPGERYTHYFGSPRFPHCGTEVSSGLPSLDSGAESDASFPTDSEDNYPASQAGVPGWPGTPDLDSCLRRLGHKDRESLRSGALPYGCRTPDSIMSTGSFRSGASGFGLQDWKMPQKLQIVKPIEGSLTLHHWSKLATPNLSGLLEDKEGIAVKGAAASKLNVEIYSMSDFEEDDPPASSDGAEATPSYVTGDGEAESETEARSEGFPGKSFEATTGVYTLTNSTILHPDDVTNLTSSLNAVQISDGGYDGKSKDFPLVVGGQRGLSSSVSHSRRGSTATFSTNVGIAKHLFERGTHSAQKGGLYSPTVTPANSPQDSRSGSPVDQFSYKLPGFSDLTKGLQAGAVFLRRTLYGDSGSSAPLSDPPSPVSELVGSRVNRPLEDQIVSLEGVESKVAARMFGGVVTSRAPTASPLLHLSNLIRSGDISGRSNSSGLCPKTTSVIDSASSSKLETISGGRAAVNKVGSKLKPGQRTDLGTVNSKSKLGSLAPTLGQRDEKMGTVGWASLGRKGGLL